MIDWILGIHLSPTKTPVKRKKVLEEGSVLSVRGVASCMESVVVLVVVAAEMVGGANPGEKMDMGLEEEGGRELYRAGAFVWLLWGVAREKERQLCGGAWVLPLEILGGGD